LEADVKKSDTEYFAAFAQSRHRMSIKTNREGRTCIDFIIVPDEDESAAVQPVDQSQFEESGAIITIQDDDDADIQDWEALQNRLVIDPSHHEHETEQVNLNLCELVDLVLDDEEEEDEEGDVAEEEYEESAYAEEEDPLDPLALSPDRQAGE
jgi:hypothetical protein